MKRFVEFAVGIIVVAALLVGAFYFAGFNMLAYNVAPDLVATIGRAPAGANGDAPAAERAETAARTEASAETPDLILDTVYGFLRGPGAEAPGYGLYSYALFPVPSARVEAFLAALFARTGWAGDSRIDPAVLNLIHLPVHADLEGRLGIDAWDGARPHPDFAAEAYDYAEARRLLAQICRQPAEAVRALCAGDLSGGPYLFTYSRPASRLDTLPPPYLVLDLGSVHPAAFTNFIAAYKAQVKRTDYTDRERIDAFNLVLPNITLTAADVVSPVVKSVKDLIALVKD